MVAWTKKNIKAIMRIFLLAITAIIIGVNTYSIIATKVTRNVLPMPFGIGATVVLSGSMEPEFSAGALLIVAEAKDLEVGDVVVFQDGSMSVTHRIIDINGDSVITKGDANNTADAPMAIQQIKGEVILAIPLVGYLVNVIKSPLGTLAIICLALILLERSFSMEKEKEKAKLDSIRAEIEKLKQEASKK